uniref:MATE family efflux transporter n=1 Tax=Enterocloster clostridioformis TaxID=1531 RepID=UPI001C3DC6DF|nr:MATE family efflux transporter [Enterocloster clostridioformis]
MAQKQDTRTQLLTASPLQLMISLSVPATIGMVVVGLYNFMDRVFVGQLINEVAMGAVSVAYPFTLINSGISTLIGVGSASVLSRAVGKKDQDTIDKIMGNLAAMNLILGIIVTAVGMIFTRQLLTLSGAEGEILNNAERYLRIIFAGSLFVNFAQSSNMIMRGEGLLKQAMVFSGGSAILNIILDPILISVLNPYGMGIDGAAYATIISQIVYAVAMLRHFICKSKNVRFHGVRIEKALVSEILGVGLSAMLMQVMTIVQQTALYRAAAIHGGETWQIILGAALSIQSFTLIPMWGASQGFQPAAGTNFGAKQYDRVKQITKAFILGATVLSLVFYIPIELAPGTVLSWFIKDTSTVSMGVTDFRFMFSSYVLIGFLLMVITLMQSLGKASKASALVLLRQIVLFVPLAFILPNIGGLGINGVFFAPPLTDLVVVVIAALMLISEFRNMTKLAAQEK